MSWRYDPTEPHVTPADTLAYFCRRHGLPAEHLALPPVLVATFQRAAHERLVARTGAAQPAALAASGAGQSLAGGVFVGYLPDSGRPVAVARLPIGAPAAVLALEGTIARGVRTLLVCGAAGSLQPELPLGSIVVVSAAEREDGTSHHYLPAEEVTSADPAATSALATAARAAGLAPVLGRAWTIDAPYRETVGAIERHRAAGVAVVDMEAAAMFAVAAVRGARAGLIVAVSDELFRPWNPGFHLPVYLDALTAVAEATLLAAEHLGDAAGEGTG